MSAKLVKIGSISGNHFNFPATSTNIEQVKSRFFHVQSQFWNPSDGCLIQQYILEMSCYFFDVHIEHAHCHLEVENRLHYTCFSVWMIHHLFIVHHFNASWTINQIPSNMTLTSNDSVKNPPSRAILPQSSKCVKGWNESQDSPLISSLFRQISLQTLAHRSMHCIISGPVNNPSLFTVHPIFNFLFPSC